MLKSESEIYLSINDARYDHLLKSTYLSKSFSCEGN